MEGGGTTEVVWVGEFNETQEETSGRCILQDISLVVGCAFMHARMCVSLELYPWRCQTAEYYSKVTQPMGNLL